MIDQLFLHVGRPKTGSSSIQKTLFKSRLALESVGVFYPRSASNQFFLASAFHPNPAGLVPNIRNDRVTATALRAYHERTLGDLKAQALERDWKTGILSTESITMLDPAALGRLRDFLQQICREIIVVAYVRHPLQDAQSRTQQRIKIGRMVWDELFEADVYPDRLKMTGPGPLKRYVDLFGQSQVRLRPFERSQLKGGDVVEDFLDTVGIDTAGLDLATGLTANVSISQEAAFAISELTHLFPPIVNGRKSGPDSRILRRIQGRKFLLPQQALAHLAIPAAQMCDVSERDFGISFETRTIDVYEPQDGDVEFREACRRIYTRHGNRRKWNAKTVLARVEEAQRKAYSL